MGEPAVASGRRRYSIRLVSVSMIGVSPRPPPSYHLTTAISAAATTDASRAHRDSPIQTHNSGDRFVVLLLALLPSFLPAYVQLSVRYSEAAAM